MGEINTVSKIRTLIKHLENATFSDWWNTHYYNDDSYRCLTYETINSVNVETDSGGDGTITIGYLSVNGQYENKRLVPIELITAKTKIITRTVAATDISVFPYGETIGSIKQIHLNYNNLTLINQANHDLNFYATISPSNVTIKDVTSYSDSLSIIQYKKQNNNITYLLIDISEEVASGNIDNLVFGTDNIYGHTFSVGTTDGTNKWATQGLRFTPVVPNNSSGENTYSYNDITVNSDYSYTISTVSFPSSQSGNTGGCVRGYESVSYVYARKEDELLDGTDFFNFSNCNPRLKTSETKLQIVSNSFSDNNLVANYKTNYPTKTLFRYFANLPDLKGHCIINFEQWVDPGNISEYPYGLDCIRKEFDFTSIYDINSMSLQLDSKLNNGKTEFLYGDDIYALWTINPSGGWIDPSLITTNNIADFCESENASLFLYDAVYAMSGIIVKLNPYVTGTNTATIYAGDNSCSIQYTVNPMIYIEKTQGKYEGHNNVDDEDPTIIEFVSSEYIKFTNFSSESRDICFVGKPIGESANSNPYVVKPVVYDATTMTAVGTNYSPDLTNYLKPVTLEPHKSYYICCDIHSNNNTNIIDYGESTDYPLYCEIRDNYSGTGTVIGNLSWIMSDETMTAPTAVDYSSVNVTDGYIYESIRKYGDDKWRRIEDDDVSDIINTLEHHKIVINFSVPVKIKTIHFQTYYRGSSSNDFANPTVNGEWDNLYFDNIQLCLNTMSEITIKDYVDGYGAKIFPTWNDIYDNLSGSDTEKIDNLWHNGHTQNDAIFKYESNITITFDDTYETTKIVQLVNYIEYDGR